MALLKGGSQDDLTLKYLLENSGGGGGGDSGEIQQILDLLGETELPTEDQTVTGAIAELSGDIDSVESVVNGKVSKSGDTMTGLLTQASSASTGIYLRNTAMQVGVTPASAQYKYITFKDKNDADLAVIYSRINTSGNIALRVGAHVGSIYNTVTFTVNPSTDARAISLDDADAWLSALGLGSVTYTSTISSIMTAASGVTISSASYAQWGKIAQVAVTLSKSSALSGTNNTVATMVSGKRPRMTTGCVLTGGASYAGINSSGQIQINGSAAANTALYIRATFILA